MTEIPADILALDDFECAERIARTRWPDGWSCARCGGRVHHHLKVRPREWSCGGCKRRISVTAGTFLHRSGVPLFVWFAAAHAITQPGGISAAAFQRATRLSRYDTAWRVLQRVRAAVSEFGAALPVPVGTTASGTEVSLRGAFAAPRDPSGAPSPVLRWRSWIEIAGARLGSDAVVIDYAARADLARALPPVAPFDRAGRDWSHADPPAWWRPRRPPPPQDAPPVLLLDWFLACVHRRVSGRWLRRYLGEAATRLAPRTPDDVMRDLLAEAPAVWDRLRPSEAGRPTDRG